MYALHFRKRRRERVDWSGISGKVGRSALKHMFLCALRPYLFIIFFTLPSALPHFASFYVFLCASPLQFPFAVPLWSSYLYCSDDVFDLRELKLRFFVKMKKKQQKQEKTPFFARFLLFLSRILRLF